jgi:hypothetical protein
MSCSKLELNSLYLPPNDRSTTPQLLTC